MPKFTAQHPTVVSLLELSLDLQETKRICRKAASFQSTGAVAARCLRLYRLTQTRHVVDNGGECEQRGGRALHRASAGRKRPGARSDQLQAGRSRRGAGRDALPPVAQVSCRGAALCSTKDRERRRLSAVFAGKGHTDWGFFREPRIEIASRDWLPLSYGACCGV